jgi:hypothetical protein
VMTDITSNLFAASGYINCVAVDPADDNKVVVVFSNYNLYSIFYSVDGGTTFTKSAGNLEVNSSGSGNGPSIRWVSIVPTANGTVYLAGTSIGIYGTNMMNGLNTVWANLSPGEIGYMVVDMIDTRTSDGYVVAGTHGAGAFSTNIIDTLLLSIQPITEKNSGLQIFPNPANAFTEIVTDASPLSELKVFDASGKIMVSRKLSYDFRINTTGFSEGVYFVEVRSEANVSVKRLLIQH